MPISGLDEYPGQTTHDKHFRRPGVSIFVASGDDGAGASYPATSPDVIAVGGTTLVDVGEPSFEERGWSGSGGGCSRYEPAHPAQKAFSGHRATGCDGRRATPDALVADPRSGVSVYQSYQTDKPWTVVGGTSAASPPMWAARSAIADLPVDAALLYGAGVPIDFRDVTAGDNGHPAGPGYDLVTGLGGWAG